MLSVCEIFKSIQGESTRAGSVCSFVRLSGCNLRCSYCDTNYAWTGGTEHSIDDICTAVASHRCALVEITGGEPLVQEETSGLCCSLIDRGHTVLVETNGTIDIGILPAGTVRIMDIKCPSSGVADRFLPLNIRRLTAHDECKFVMSDHEDFLWAQSFVTRHRLLETCTVFFSPNTAQLAPSHLAAWILDADARIRLGTQLHKFIWPHATRGF